jgi:hypothetical protein
MSMHLQFSFWCKVKKMAQQVMATASSFMHRLSMVVKINEQYSAQLYCLIIYMCGFFQN